MLPSLLSYKYFNTLYKDFSFSVLCRNMLHFEISKYMGVHLGIGSILSKGSAELSLSIF